MKARLSIIFLFPFIAFSCSQKKDGIKPEYRDVTEAVYSTVLVEPRHSYKVYPPVSGIIEQLMIEEGDEVKKGDLIIKISDNKSKVNERNAQLQFELAKESFDGESAILKEIEENIKTATVKVINDSLNYVRQKSLWQQDVGSKQEYEKRKLAYDISKNDLDRLLNAYKRSESELQHQVEIARNTLKINQLTSEDFNVRSKLDGLVYSLEKEEGESVSAQSAIAIIGSKSDFILSLLIDEVDIRKVNEGQKVIISLDAYPDITYEARISKIYPEKNERSQTFDVEAEFVTKPDRLLKGLSGEANIIIDIKKDVLTLPSQYITENNMVNTSEGLIAVEIGLRSLEYTEILSGIDSSTVIKISE